jgi:alpha-glucosidase
MLAIWLAGQSGTLFLYQGQEIGMTNAPEEWSMYEDGEVESQNSWTEALRLTDDGTVLSRMEKDESGLRIMSRDHAWLPYQWDDTANGGFSTSKPWIPMHSAYQQVNAAAQEKDADSVLSFYKRMLRLRKEHKDVFVYGSFELLDPEGRDTFVYRKRYGKKMALLVFNFSTDPCALLNMEGMRCLVSSYSKDLPDTLRPLEGRVYVNY